MHRTDLEPPVNDGRFARSYALPVAPSKPVRRAVEPPSNGQPERTRGAAQAGPRTPQMEDQRLFALAMAAEREAMQRSRMYRLVKASARLWSRAHEIAWRWYLMAVECVSAHAGGFVPRDVRGGRLQKCGGCTLRVTREGHDYCGACSCPKKTFWPLARLTWKTRLAAWRCPVRKFDRIRRPLGL